MLTTELEFCSYSVLAVQNYSLYTKVWNMDVAHWQAELEEDL